MSIGMDSYFKIIKGQSSVDKVNVFHTIEGFTIASNITAKYRPRSVTSQHVAVMTKLNTESIWFLMFPGKPDKLLQVVVNLWRMGIIRVFEHQDTPEKRFVMIADI